MRRRAARNPQGPKPLVRSLPRGQGRDFYDHKGAAYNRLKDRTGYRCEACKAQCRRPGEDVPEQPSHRIVHQDGRGANFCDENLLLICEHCYNSRYLNE